MQDRKIAACGYKCQVDCSVLPRSININNNFSRCLINYLRIKKKQAVLVGTT